MSDESDFREELWTSLLQPITQSLTLTQKGLHDQLGGFKEDLKAMQDLAVDQEDDTIAAFEVLIRQIEVLTKAFERLAHIITVEKNRASILSGIGETQILALAGAMAPVGDDIEQPSRLAITKAAFRFCGALIPQYRLAMAATDIESLATVGTEVDNLNAGLASEFERILADRKTSLQKSED